MNLRRDGWNLYTYASGNPVNRVDPDGLKDRRSTEDIAILEDPDVLAAVAEIREQTLLDELLQDRQEAGATVAVSGNGDFDVPEGVVTQGNLKSVKLTLRRQSGGEITTQGGKEVAATIHSHPGTGELTINGRRQRLVGGAASQADRRQVRVTGKPLYILNANQSVIRVILEGEKVKTKKILTKKDFRQFVDRAEAAREDGQ